MLTREGDEKFMEREVKGGKGREGEGKEREGKGGFLFDGMDGCVCSSSMVGRWGLKKRREGGRC